MPTTPETPDTYGAYPRLSDPQLAALAKLGQRQTVAPDTTLFDEGTRACDFFAILSGRVALVEGHGTINERIISVHGRGRFIGEPSATA